MKQVNKLPEQANNFENNALSGFLRNINPLQFISENIARLAYYKQQIKALETEQLRITSEAALRHHQIDAALKAGLQILEERRITLQMNLQLVSNDLQNVHIEKQQLLKQLEILINTLSNPKSSIADKQMAHTTIPVLTTLLKETGEQSIIKLDRIALTSQKMLEAMPQPDLMLTLNGE